MELGHSEKLVIEFFHKNRNVAQEYFSPSIIGRTIKGEPYHSSWASPICLRLVKKGLLERNKRGHYALVTR